MSFFLTACGQSPRTAAQLFSENVAHGKITEAKQYATEHTQSVIEKLSSAGVLTRIDPDFKFIFVDESIDGNKAVVKFRETENGRLDSLNLVKVGGQWKVHLSEK